MTKRALIPALALLWGASACSKNPPPATAPGPAAGQPTATGAVAAKAPLAADDVIRIPPAEARNKVQREGALLVCAYDSDDKFAKLALDGAIPRSRFTAQIKQVPKDKQLIFYCA